MKEGEKEGRRDKGKGRREGGIEIWREEWMREHCFCNNLYFNCAFIYLHPAVRDVASNFLSLWMENLLHLQKKHFAPNPL